jgi:o-succinylbenzoate synthase
VTLAVRIEPTRLRLVSVVATGHGAIRFRTGVLVGLDDGEHVGWGEASPLPGWSSVTLVDTERAARAALEGVYRDTDMAGVIASLHSHPYARAAVSGAWADLRARRGGLPLALSLSSRRVESVAVNALLGASDPELLEREAAVAVAEGYTTLKLKVGATAPAIDVERIRAARRGGPEAGLRLDANQAWDRETAIDVLRRVVDQDIEWCEEPTPFLDEFGSIESAAGTRVAADESLVTDGDLRHALALGMSVVVLKPQAVGGPDRAAGIAKLASEAGAVVVVTSFMDSAVGVAHAVHVASAFGSPVAHGLATARLLADDIGPAPVVESGAIRLPTSPGIGFEPRLTEPLPEP